jgi:hypothetical protein
MICQIHAAPPHRRTKEWQGRVEDQPTGVLEGGPACVGVGHRFAIGQFHQGDVRVYIQVRVMRLEFTSQQYGGHFPKRRAGGQLSDQGGG